VASSSSTVVPATCRSLSEGRESTQALITAGVGAHPVANFPNNINVGNGIEGYKDWYIPARDELELCLRNLRPNTPSGSTANLGETIYGFRITGEFPDLPDQDGVEQKSGTNRNSSPPGISYYDARLTTPDNRFPPQTAALIFKDGGSEAFAWGSAFSGIAYLSSTSTGSVPNYVWAIEFGPASIQTKPQTQSSLYTRLVRRSVI
jgi:hypothetical protein